MNQKNPDEKLENLDDVLIHYTTPNNALLAIEYGLMPLEQLTSKGIYPESSNLFGGVSLCPNKISFFKRKNMIKEGLDPLSTEDNLFLIIDGKYIPNTDEMITAWGNRHPSYEGTIPPKGILGIVVEKHQLTPKSKNIFQRGFHKLYDSLGIKFGKQKFKQPEYSCQPTLLSKYLSASQKERFSQILVPIFVFDKNEKGKKLPCRLYDSS